MCCELCAELEDCEHCYEDAEDCCPNCAQFEDCPTRLELDSPVYHYEEGPIEDFYFSS
jgi:hypothetical protein